MAHGIGVVVLTLTGDKVAAMTRFEPGLLGAFGLPRLLPTPAAPDAAGQAEMPKRSSP